jgi:LysR family nitrogen assimilation transcriptional regulator
VFGVGARLFEEDAVDVRQLEALLAVAETGSFTAAADHLHTVQSNVSEHVRQLEAEVGVQLLVRGRRGTVPTEFGVRVVERARAIRSEIEALHKDLSMLQGLETGHATLGVVGTVSRLLVPMVVAEMRRSAPGVSLRLTEGASERLAGEVAGRQLASAVVTEPVSDPRLHVEHLRDEALVALVPTKLQLHGREPIALAELARETLILPPAGNPLRDEVETAARAERVELRVPIEVEGVRLIADLVGAGVGVSILPETAVAHDHVGVRQLRIARMPPRRLALVTARGVQLSLADQAVHDAVRRLVRDERLPQDARPATT